MREGKNERREEEREMEGEEDGRQVEWKEGKGKKGGIKEG